jgi:hypothetical protein
MTPVPVKFWIRVAIVMAGLLTGPLVQASLAATVTVPGNYPTIQAAINAVLSGAVPDHSTINVQPGTYNEALVVGGVSNKSFTVRGTGGSGSTIVDAAGKGAAVLEMFLPGGQQTFRGLTFRHGAPPNNAGGGFVLTQSSPAFVDVVFELNTASGGAGGAMFTSSPTFTEKFVADVSRSADQRQLSEVRRRRYLSRRRVRLGLRHLQPRHRGFRNRRQHLEPVRRGL